MKLQDTVESVKFWLMMVEEACPHYGLLGRRPSSKNVWRKLLMSRICRRYSNSRTRMDSWDNFTSS